MTTKEEIIPIVLDENQTIFASVTMLGGEEDVVSQSYSFDSAISAVEGIARRFSKVFESVKPEKATVEFNLKLSVGSGKLAALLVDGKSDASIKISLQWGS